MKLITNKQVPEWYITYPNVQNGYRNIGDMKETFFSIFEWHNETLNIYTHLLPGLFYLWKFLNIIPNNLYSFELYFLINIAYFGAACMGIFSRVRLCWRPWLHWCHHWLGLYRFPFTSWNCLLDLSRRLCLPF
jgi:adiponectin receptor